VSWLMYLHYGDREAVETNYPAMRRWLELCVPKSAEGRTWQPPDDHGEAEAGYGDHGRPTARWYEPHTGDLIETLHTIHCFRMAEQMAALLGKGDDAQHYARVRERLIAKVNRDEFLDRDTGVYGGGDQGCQALAVHQNVAPPGLRDLVAQRLIENVTEAHDGHLDTGFVGTWYLLKALALLSRSDVALRVVANPTPPSFACLLRHPDTPEELTLLPEFHGSGMIPHPGWCSVGAWFYEALAGITPDWEQPGFRRFTVRPQITADLDWVQAEHDALAGTIRVEWTCRGRQVELAVGVPANCTAYVHVPAKSREAVHAPASAQFVRTEPTCVVFETAGGTHVFRSVLGDM